MTSNIDYIMTSSLAALNYLMEIQAKVVLVIGGQPALPIMLTAKGITPVTRLCHNIDAVVVGYTRAFDITLLEDAVSAIKNGARFICTDRDAKFADEHVHKPGTGWIVAAIETVTGVKPLLAGKPNSYSLITLLKAMALECFEVVLVGDNMASDIVAARSAGVMAGLVLGGVSTRKDAASCPHELRPDLVVSDFEEFTKIILGDPHAK